MAVVLRIKKFACDFCGKDQDQTAWVFVGPNNICICSECVAECVQILLVTGHKEEKTPPTPPEEAA
jgi:ATP-dependent protease Clp ATPase subunit